VYGPLEEHPEMAREFAKIVSPDDALNFANKYGLLGLKHLHGEEDVWTWLGEATILRRAFRLWDLIDTGENRELAKLIEWQDSSVLLKIDGLKFPIANWLEYGDWVPKWKRGDVLGPAKLWIIRSYNEKMIGKASPTVLLSATGEFKPYTTPLNLLAAMWALYGKVITGNRRERPCEICGERLDVTENRKHKRVHDSCSLRERMKRYRLKKKGGKDGKTKTR